MRRCCLAIAAAAGLATLGAGGSVASAAPPGVAVTGAVSAPATYSRSALEAMPQSTFSVTQETSSGPVTEMDTGVSLENVVNASQPILPSVKNALLTVVVAVRGQAGRQVTFALGELDPSFGNHPAYLVLDENGSPLAVPELVVPGDDNGARTVPAVRQISVAIEDPAPTTPPVPGAITIDNRGVITTLGPSDLAALPAETLTVTFLAGMNPQTDVEIGPTLAEVLSAAHVRVDLNTWVAAVGSDGYVATVTPAEAVVGGRPLLISLNENATPLAQPRLVTDGDVKGGRYVSGIYNLAVGSDYPPTR